MEKNNLNWKDLIVRVFARSAEGEQYNYRGTAFLVNDRYLLTVRHVIEPFREGFEKDPDRIVLKNGPWDGNQYLAEAPIPHPNEKIDIALVRLRMPNSIAMEYWPLVENNELIGRTVKIAGFDDEKVSSSAPPFFVLGELNQYWTVSLQEKIQHGKSGGPVIFNEQIVGILCARTDAPEPQKDQNQTFIYPYGVFEKFLSDQGVEIAGVKSKPKPPLKKLHPDERVALIDRRPQWEGHIERRITTEKDRKTFAFVVAGVKEEWPESLKLRLRIHLQGANASPITLRQFPGPAENWEHDFWTGLLAHFPMADFTESSEAAALKSKLTRELCASPTPLLFYCYLDPVTSRQLNFIRDIARAWESLQLADSKLQHFLLLVYGTVEKGQGLASYVRALAGIRGDRKVNKWRRELAKQLAESHLGVVAPELDSPTREEIIHWSRTVLDNSEEQTLFDDALDKIKAKKIPHLTLMTTYIKLARHMEKNGSAR